MARAKKKKTKAIEQEKNWDSATLIGTSQIDPDIKFRSPQEFAFAHNWAETYPDLDLWYEWPIGPKHPINGARKSIDFYHKHAKVGIELNGGIYNPNMGHSSGEGIQNGYDKQNLCNELGINLFQLSTNDMHKPEVLDLIARAIYKALRGENNGVH